MTRQERRATRLQRLVTAREPRLASWLAHLDYKVSGESGALKVPGKVRTWHLNNRKNGHQPPPGQSWDRSGPVYLVGPGETTAATLALRQLWRRLTVEMPADSTQ
jgi:hypothetical protein